MSDTPKLRPCPFCMFPAVIFSEGQSDPYRRRPGCCDCGAEIDAFNDDDTAAAAWNRRPIEDALIAACEKIAEAVGPTQDDGSAYMNGRDLIAARDAALAAIAKARGEVMP